VARLPALSTTTVLSCVATSTVSLRNEAMWSTPALVRESDSLRQFVVVGNNAQASSLQCGSYAEAEVIRRTTA